jgi:cation diffusion facilitator family transporter
MTNTVGENKYKEVRRVLLITLVLNVAVAAGKIIIGAMTGALAISADGLHSLVDASGNLVGLVGTQLAGRPPDDSHPYGHERYETLAALVIGALLLLTAWEIVQGVVERLQDSTPPEITPLAFGVMLVTLVINFGVSRYQIREGKRLGSQVLIADAANTSADVWVTSSVILSMGLIALTGWAWLDAVMALIITVLIARAAWQVMSQTGRVLVDTAPYTPEQLQAWVEAVPSVGKVLRVRSRGPEDAAHIDIDVQVAPEMTADQTNAIAGAIRQKLTDELGSVSEVEVHFSPAQDQAPDVALMVRAQGDALGLATHEVCVIEGPQGPLLDLHVEVPPGLTLAQAHEQVCQLEEALYQHLPHIVEIVSHIEPAASPEAETPDYQAVGGLAELRTKILALLRQHYPLMGWHKLRVYPAAEGYTTTMHLGLPANISVEAAHRIAEDAEAILRAELPQFTRITIHTEPNDAV